MCSSPGVWSARQRSSTFIKKQQQQQNWLFSTWHLKAANSFADRMIFMSTCLATQVLSGLSLHGLPRSAQVCSLLPRSVCAFIASVNSYVHLPCCIQRVLFPYSHVLTVALSNHSTHFPSMIPEPWEKRMRHGSPNSGRASYNLLFFVPWPIVSLLITRRFWNLEG